VTQLLTNRNTQGGPKYQSKYTQTHNGTNAIVKLLKGVKVLRHTGLSVSLTHNLGVNIPVNDKAKRAGIAQSV
jgi:hypothetical protein